MKLVQSGFKSGCRPQVLSGFLVVGLFFTSFQTMAVPAQTPLNISTGTKANLLMILDNSNSMDEEPNGQAAGSNNPTSKSEIARNVMKNLIDQYKYRLNMGLMSYQQYTPVDNQIHKSFYDASYNPANFNPAFEGDRASSTKRYRAINPADPTRFIYYNVGLPFYSAVSYGNAFCYAPNSVPFRTNETFPNGPWDEYRCFQSKTGISDAMPIWGNDASEAGNGFTGYWFTSSFFPTDSDLAQGILDFGKHQVWQHVGPTYFSNSSPGRGYLNVPIKDLDDLHANTLKASLACNVPGLPAPCLASGIKNAGLTPIEGTLKTALDYFKNQLSNTAEGFVANSTYPLPVSCGKDFVILLTDGLPSTNAAGQALTDPVAALEAAAEAARLLREEGVETYVVGFALPYGTDPATLNQIAVAGGTQHAYNAQDTQTLTNTLSQIIQDILARSASFSSLAANASVLNSDTLLFQATYDVTDWSGALKAFAFDYDQSTQTLTVRPQWNATIPPAAERKLLTLNPTPVQDAPVGIELLWANLSSAPVGSSQQDYLNTLSGVADGLGASRLNWLRGDQSQERSNGGPFRSRSSLLGDIARSSPVYVARQDFGYERLTTSDGQSYKNFRSSTSYLNRRPTIYAGANDGFLHAFDATKTTEGGKEIFAYMPNSVFPKLSRLTSPAYIHESYVDGPITVSDAYFLDSSGGTFTPSGSWRTVLLGALGAGGKAMFALDITTPDQFDVSDVLWEFSAQTDTVNGPDLGYSLPQPVIGKLQNGKWVAIVANGYDSDNGRAVLFILDIQTGAVLAKLDTAAGDATNKNGLSSPLAVDTNGDLMIDTVYAGDLLGNLWKFDVSGAINQLTAPTMPFFVACTQAGAGTACTRENRQPITSKPVAGPVSKKITDQNNLGRMIYFGTGKYFEVGDNVVGSNPQVQAFYGLWDKSDGTTRVNSIAELTEQTIDFEGPIPGAPEYGYRLVSSHPVCYTINSPGCSGTSPLVKGWYMRLIPPAITAGRGERVIATARVRNGLLRFTTIIPSADACQVGGGSALMRLNALTGGEPAFVAVDLNGDGLFDDHDKHQAHAVSGTLYEDMRGGETALTVEQARNLNDGLGGIVPPCEPGYERYPINRFPDGRIVWSECQPVGSSLTNSRSWRQLR